MSHMRKKYEFSKLMMVGFGVSYFSAEAFLMVMIYKIFLLFASLATVTYLAALATIITAFCTFTAAPVAVAAGFYSNKAKAENIVKIDKVYDTKNVIGDTDTAFCNENAKDREDF